MIQSLIKEVVQIEISGKKLTNGTLIDVGSDMIVLFNGVDFVYIPTIHIQKYKVDRNNEYNIKAPSAPPSIIIEEKNEELSFRRILTQAKGSFVEVYATGNQSLHGSIVDIMDDYFIFQSPIYKTVYIPLHHLQWLIPYTQNERPYGLDVDDDFSSKPNHESFAKIFEVQVEKFKNKVVIFNIAGNKNHIGKINQVKEQVVEIQTARMQPVYLNLHHIKTLHLM